MTILNFGAFEPDKAPLNSGYTFGRNALRKANSYGPAAGLAQVGVAALPTRCKGLGFARTGTGAWQVYAGTATKLYKLVAGVWTDYSRLAGGNYAVPTKAYWHFEQFGPLLFATNFADTVQNIDVDDGAAVNFVAATGSPPITRKMRTIGDFLHAVGMPSDARNHRWSAINDAEQWSPGSNYSDFQPIQSGGNIQDVLADGLSQFGEKRVVMLQERAARIMTFLPGSDYVYDFAPVEGARGCIAPYATAAVGNVGFYLGEGPAFFSITSDGAMKPIGATRVDKWFKANTDPARLDEVICVADPVKPLIHFAAYSTASAADLDLMLTYNWQIDEWSVPCYVSAEIWAAVAAPAVTLEQLDNINASLDLLPASLDAPEYQGSKPSVGAMDDNGKLAFLSGPALEAVLVSSEYQLTESQRSFVNEVSPVADAVSTLRIGYRERLQDAVNYKPSVSLNAQGKFTTRSSSRLHRFELTIPAGSSWEHAQGVDVKAVPDGDR